MSANLTIYPSALQRIANNTLNLGNGSLFVCLTDQYQFDYNHSNAGNISIGECVGANYTSGGFNCGLPALFLDAENSVVRLTHNDPYWANVTINCNGAILYKKGADNETSYLIMHMNMAALNNGNPLTLSLGNLTIQAESGSLQIQGIAA